MLRMRFQYGLNNKAFFVQATTDPLYAFKIWIQRIYVPRLLEVFLKFVCIEVLLPSQPNGVMSSAVSLPNHTFTGQA